MVTKISAAAPAAPVDQVDQAGAVDQAGQGFEDLVLEANALEGGPPIPGSAEATQVAVDQVDQAAAELEQALLMARLMVKPMFAWWPAFETTWNDGAIKGIAAGGAAVMQKHGWTLGEVFSTYGPYIALAMATLPPATATYAAIKEQKRAAAAAAKASSSSNDGQRQAPH